VKNEKRSKVNEQDDLPQELPLLKDRIKLAKKGGVVVNRLIKQIDFYSQQPSKHIKPVLPPSQGS